MLITLPDITWPVTKAKANTLMVDVQQLNILEGGLSEPSQRGLGIYFHTFDLWVKSKGKIDYRGVDGHRRLVEDAMRFVGTGNPVATKHGDIAAAHLSLDWHDTQMRLDKKGTTRPSHHGWATCCTNRGSWPRSRLRWRRGRGCCLIIWARDRSFLERNLWRWDFRICEMDVLLFRGFYVAEEIRKARGVDADGLRGAD